MINRLREYENQAVQKTLTSSYCPEPIREARERQDEILRVRFEGGSYAIADIGCGDGYHGSIFAPSGKLYHGFEIAPALAEMAQNRWRSEKLDNAEVFVLDVSRAELEPEIYDLVFCLYFTPGNFRDESDDMKLYSDAYLDRNPRFVAVVSRFYRAMKSGGSMFLTIYKDVPEAERAQRDFYTKTGQTVVTPEGLRFVATEQNFWSVRWTREGLLSNLRECRIVDRDVEFHDLNVISWLVEIHK